MVDTGNIKSIYYVNMEKKSNEVKNVVQKTQILPLIPWLLPKEEPTLELWNWKQGDLFLGETTALSSNSLP
jgi:hypothetical protein